MKNCEEIEERCLVNGEVAVKPYRYMRNGLLHIRYTVDRCVELSKTEEETIKNEITQHPENKQEILSKYWNLLTVMVKKPIIKDGIRAVDNKIKDKCMRYKKHENGYKN